MMKNDSPDYLMETRLRELNPDLHRRFTDTAVTIQSVLHAVHIDPFVDRMVWDMAVKMQETLEYSREATFQRSPFRISQREVRLVYLD